ncbi:MAG TPA: sugar ABC transporter substrate-binding protein [Spirochaetota bacterium]|nr:sugar ABC transporter substrate-binding protein [Spirochaetota bacterium]
MKYLLNTVSPGYLTLIILFFITACGTGGDQKQISMAIWGTPEQADVERVVLKKVKSRFPDVDIGLLHYSASKYHRKMLVMHAAQSMPDILMVQGWQLPEYAARDMLIPLNDLIKKDNYSLDHFFDFAKVTFSVHNKLYGLPRDIAGRIMFYNKDILKKAGLQVPKTWREFKNCCTVITRMEGEEVEYGAAAWEIWFNLLWSMGGDVFDNPKSPTRSTVNSEAAMRSLIYLYNLYKKKIVAPSDKLDRLGPNELFKRGKVAFSFGGRWSTPEFKDNKNLNWGIAPVPAGPAGAYSISGGTCYSISRQSKNKQLAWEIIKYYTSNECVKTAIKGGRTTPALKDIANSDFFLKSNNKQDMSVYIWSIKHGRRWCLTKERYNYEVIIFREIGKLEKLLITPDQAQYNLHKSLTKELQKN